MACPAGSAGRRETVRDLKQQEAELRRLLQDERKRCAVAEADRDEALDRANSLEERSAGKDDQKHVGLHCACCCRLFQTSQQAYDVQ